MAERKWFYWKAKSTQGFMAVVDTIQPGKTSTGPGPRLLRPAVELVGDQLDWSLDRCIQEWPKSSEIVATIAKMNGITEEAVLEQIFVNATDDGRPYSTDEFIRQLCGSTVNSSDNVVAALNAWNEGAWAEALEYLE